MVSRREAAGGILGTIGGALLLGCGGATGTANGSSSSSGGSSSGGSSSGAPSSSSSSGSSAGTWATGGTKSMTGTYPDPFPLASAACVLMTAVTEGPCTEAADQVRKDISEGLAGLPMRLALRIVDADCKAIAGAKVKIWHTQISGSYSGNTPNNGMCLKDASDASKHYFRGVQTTDDDGRVDFDSCFPGWYRGRTIHIHFTVSVNGKSFTSQLVFDQTLVGEIFTSHDEYKGYGLPDTTNASDNVVGSGDIASFTLVTSRMNDGAMLAAKEIQVKGL